MKEVRCSRVRVIVVLLVFLGGLQIALKSRADQLDAIGVTLLRTVTTNVDGTGIRVAQPEAWSTNNPPDFEVNPANGSVQKPASLFTYIGTDGTANFFPNSLGTESGHADTVASYFYGLPGGVATNVAHVDNYDANYFYNGLIATTAPSNIGDRVVNQSFIFGYVPGQVTVAEQQQLDSKFDDYAAQYNTLFVSGAGNGGPTSGSVAPPSTCYNGLSVGAYGYTNSSVGPTEDNGRAKPDITAPASATSFSTPQVTGAAAALIQAGLRGDGGSNTNSAADIRTIKALLLNGAIKPVDWTNVPPSPLDARYGAGVLNVFNSYEQLAGGKHTFIANTTVSTNSPHPPTSASGTVSTLSGWDFNTLSSSMSSDSVNHYYFNVTNGLSGAAFTGTATLVWNRQTNKTDVNHLDLFLYDVASSNQMDASTSAVDNMEHLWLPQLPQGRYDLQVLKHGGNNTVSSGETYALAFEFFSLPLKVTPSGGNVVLTWPVYPAGFVVESTPGLTPPIVWSTVSATPIVTNKQNRLTLGVNASQYFRLRRP
jgi:Subtilase family